MKRAAAPVTIGVALVMVAAIVSGQTDSQTPSTAGIPGWTALQTACFEYLERKRAEDPEKGPDRWPDLACRFPEDPLGERTLRELAWNANELEADESVPKELLGCIVGEIHESGRIGPREYLKPYDANHPVFEDLYDVRRLYRRVLHAARESCEARSVASDVGRTFLASAAALAGIGVLGGAWFVLGQRRAVAAAAQAHKAIMAETKGVDRRATPLVFFADRMSAGGSAQRLALAVVEDRILLAPLDGGSLSAITHADLSVHILESKDQACRMALESKRGGAALVRFSGAVDLVRLANLLIGKRIPISYRRDQ